MFLCGINATLVHARNYPPFPAFLAFHIANLPPMHWLMGPLFGPRSKSCYLSDPRVIDPFLVQLGRNVVVGFGAIIAGHWRLRDSITLKRTIIEDDVVIGGNAIIFGGVHIKSGSVIAAGAVVRPGTVIGPNEFWGGVPARKIRDLPAAPEPAGD
jgi:acetyltransferase-like isoleucine patch superfamily enzyme